MTFAFTDDEHDDRSFDEQTIRGLDRLWAAILDGGEPAVDRDLQAHSRCPSADGAACDAFDPGEPAGPAFLSSRI